MVTDAQKSGDKFTSYYVQFNSIQFKCRSYTSLSVLVTFQRTALIQLSLLIRTDALNTCSPLCLPNLICTCNWFFETSKLGHTPGLWKSSVIEGEMWLKAQAILLLTFKHQALPAKGDLFGRMSILKHQNLMTFHSWRTKFAIFLCAVSEIIIKTGSEATDSDIAVKICDSKGEIESFHCKYMLGTKQHLIPKP